MLTRLRQLTRVQLYVLGTQYPELLRVLGLGLKEARLDNLDNNNETLDTAVRVIHVSKSRLRARNNRVRRQYFIHLLKIVNLILDSWHKNIKK